MIVRKCTANCRNQRLLRHLAADYTIIMLRTLKVTVNHVMCMISYGNHVNSSRSLCCLPSLNGSRNMTFFRSVYHKTIIISRLIKVSVRVSSLRLRVWLITPTSTLIILDITKNLIVKIDRIVGPHFHEFTMDSYLLDSA